MSQSAYEAAQEIEIACRAILSLTDFYLTQANGKNKGLIALAICNALEEGAKASNKFRSVINLD